MCCGAEHGTESELQPQNLRLLAVERGRSLDLCEAHIFSLTP